MSLSSAQFDSWLRTLLKPELFKDYCPNGILVEGENPVRKVLTGVSFSQDLIDHALRIKADAIVVHHPHGFWNNQPRLPIGALGRKIKALQANGISLWGFHLPLDGHPEIGNNIGIARSLGLQPTGTFMREGAADVGLLCRLPSPMPIPELKHRLEQAFGKGPMLSFLHGPTEVDAIAICSGGGTSGLDEALRLGFPVFITGEIKESHPIQAKEEGFHLFACGHHATETFGPRLLAERIQKDLGIPSEFVNIPNPV